MVVVEVEGMEPHRKNQLQAMGPLPNLHLGMVHQKVPKNHRMDVKNNVNLNQDMELLVQNLDLQDQDPLHLDLNAQDLSHSTDNSHHHHLVQDRKDHRHLSNKATVAPALLVQLPEDMVVHKFLINQIMVVHSLRSNLTI